MLYGQLKAIMKEEVKTDEPKLDDEGNPIEEPKPTPKNQKHKKPKKRQKKMNTYNYMT